MKNSTDIVSFVLATYGDVGNFKYLYFAVAMLLFVSIIFVNMILTVIICLDRNLHEPMYLFLSSLFVNEIYGSVSLLPCVMVQVLSETHEISTFYCFLQIFNIHSYVAVEFGLLTIMAYDRYVCICKPLHYNVIMTKCRVRTAIAVIWTVSFVEMGVLLSFTVRLRFCGTVIQKFSCHNSLVVELSCSPDRILSFLQDVVIGLICSVATPLCFISFTYVKIFAVSLKASEATKTKAFDTCTPHLISLISFVFACFYNVITHRLDVMVVPLELHVVLSVYGVTVQPLLNPVIYGLKLTKIRHAVKKFVILKAGKRHHMVNE